MPVRFGAFEVDLQAGELRKHGVRLQLQEQPFRVLQALVERPGEVVSREELIGRLWPDGTHVDFDRGLNAAVTRLRQALSDSAETPRYVETVARRGYRFIAPLQTEPQRSPLATSRWVWAAAVLALVAIATMSWLSQESEERAGEPDLPVPLTTYPGFESRPSLSPDGSRVAFEWDQDAGDTRIYVKVVGTGEPVRLTSGRAPEYSPAWSPDGRQIAFLRSLGPVLRVGVFVTPALGGIERQVTELTASGELAIPRIATFRGLLTWAPDGRHLVVTAERNDGTGNTGLRLISVDDGRSDWLLPPSPEPTIGDAHPAFSPDGRTLAFVRRASRGAADIWLVPASADGRSTGEPRRLTHLNRAAAGLAWLPSGSAIVFSNGYIDTMHLFRVSIGRKAEPAALLAAGSIATQPTISGGKLVYTRRTDDRNIWRQEIPLRSGVLPAPVKLIQSTEGDSNPQYSPDGERIVFASNRSGTTQIWTCASDGSHCMQLTNEFTGRDVGTPRWSPDGNLIAFDAAQAGHFDVYLVSAMGGAARRLTHEPGDDGMPSFSRDGAHIYFWSGRSGADEIWRIPVSGGPAVQVTRNGSRTGGVTAWESWDGAWLYYARPYALRPQVASLRRLSLSGDAEDTEVLGNVYGRQWILTRDRLWYKTPVDRGAELRYLELATGRDVALGKGPPPNDHGLSVSPDGRYVIYSQNDNPGSDLMLIENFR